MNPVPAIDPVATDPGWREWFANPELQRGLGLAILGPFVTCFGGIAVVQVRGLHPEYGLGWIILHIAAFGVLQLVWILPVAGIGALIGKRRLSYGLLVGAGVLLLANGLAWIVGLTMGAV